MKPEDFPLVEFKGRRLRMVPELPYNVVKQRTDMCLMCIAHKDAIGVGLCKEMRSDPRPGDCGYHEYGPLVPEVITWNTKGFIYLPEERFEEYVVELVRRRVS
jgi:hypothetical protein